jgi:hypothetical protein
MSFLLAALMLLVQAPGQAGQAAPAAIEGVAQHAVTGAPITGARVTLMRFVRVSNEFGGAEPAAAAVTDPQGHFRFPDLPEGAYAVQISLDGYFFLTDTHLPPAANQRPGGAALVELTRGRSITDVVFRAVPAGTIAGRIINTTGEPVTGISVEAFKKVYDAAGGQQFSASGATMTNEQGQFRIAVRPGRGYYVVARDSRAIREPERYGGAIYPGVMDAAAATTTDVGSGATVVLKNLTIRPQRLFAIRGRVIDSGTGRPPRDAAVWITTAALLGGETITAMPVYDRATGAFETRVGAGSYALGATVPNAPLAPTAPSAPMLMPPMTAEALVTILNADVSEIVLRVVRPPVSIGGRLSLDQQRISSLPGWERIRVVLTPSRNGVPMLSNSPAPPNLLVTPDGTFQLFGSMLGEFRLNVTGLPGDAFVQAARFGDAEALQQPLRLTGTSSDTLDIVISTTGGRIEGSVVVAERDLPARVQVVVVPDQRERRDLFRATTPDRDGRFTIRGVAPGSYKAFAFTELAPFEYFDPAVIAGAERSGAGVKVQVTQSSIAKIDLRVTKID